MTISDTDLIPKDVPLTNSVSLSNTTLLCVGGTTNFLVAAGTKGSLTVSPNVLVPVVQTNEDSLLITNNASTLGVIWYSLPPPAGTTNDLAGTCAFNNNFYLVGGNGTILDSADGTNWSEIASGTTKYLSGIAGLTNGVLAVAGDDGTILTSLDGTNWTSRVSGTKNWIYRLRCVSGMLLGVGENGTITTSLDGVAWTLGHSGVTNWLNDAVMVSNTCYIVGNQGVVLSSTNCVDCTETAGITLKALEGAATQNGQLVAVGFEGSILTSQVYPITTPVNFVSYGQSDGYNVFSVAGVVGQQFTLDSSTNLTSWITGPKLDLIFGDGTLIFYQAIPPSPPLSQFYRCTLVP